MWTRTSQNMNTRMWTPNHFILALLGTSGWRGWSRAATPTRGRTRTRLTLTLPKTWGLVWRWWLTWNPSAGTQSIVHLTSSRVQLTFCVLLKCELCLKVLLLSLPCLCIYMSTKHHDIKLNNSSIKHTLQANVTASLWVSSSCQFLYFCGPAGG